MTLRLRRTGSPTAVEIETDKAVILFSYETPVAFWTRNGGYVVCENVWGNTTGKHMNAFHHTKPADRVPRADFLSLLDSVI